VNYKAKSVTDNWFALRFPLFGISAFQPSAFGLLSAFGPSAFGFGPPAPWSLETTAPNPFDTAQNLVRLPQRDPLL
jgi:hypothetical protein